jgi:hypothetical protein
MAIQGILCGFADPANLAANVILTGRGDNYVLIVDGKPTEAHAEIAPARTAFRKTADAHCGAHWLSVSEIRTDGVNGHSTVVETEKLNASYAERYPVHPDEDEPAD